MALIKKIVPALLLTVVLAAVPPQNLTRREMLGAMLARVTKRTELGPLCASPTAQHASRFAASDLAARSSRPMSCGTETLA